VYVFQEVFRILGRTSVDIIKSGGYKLSALEIESSLLQIPFVQEVTTYFFKEMTTYLLKLIFEGNNNLFFLNDFHTENGSSQGQDLALTGLFVPRSLDSGGCKLSALGIESRLIMIPFVQEVRCRAKRE